MNKLFFVLPVITILSCESHNNSQTSEPSNPQTYQEKKMTLEETEKANPTDFLKVTGTYRQNLIDQWVVEGSVTNSASVATYKDVVLDIVYFSKTQTAD